MSPVQYQSASSAGSFFSGENNPEGNAARMGGVRKVPAWKSCTYLPSPQNLSDEISQQARRSINESPTCRVYFVLHPDEQVRFTGTAKIRLCQCGVACKEVEDSLVLPKSESGVSAGAFPKRCPFVASLKINRWLETLVQPEASKDSRCVDWSLEPGDLFEFYSESSDSGPSDSEPSGRWQPAMSATCTIPQVLLNPRYITITISHSSTSSCARLHTWLDRYEADMAARYLAETMSVFCYALNTDRADAGKVADMKMLFSPNQYRCSPHDDDVDDKPGELSAKEFLERIKSAPGGYDYLTLLEEKPVYKADSIDINQMAMPERYSGAQSMEAVPK